MPREGWPAELASRAGVLAVFVGGCGKSKPGWRFQSRTDAHAHRRLGVICFRNESMMRDREVVLHELAHLIDPRGGHTESFRRTLKGLGGTPPPKRRKHEWGERDEQHGVTGGERCAKCGLWRTGRFPHFRYLSNLGT